MTSAVVGLGIGSVTLVRSGTASLGADISGGLSQASVISLGTVGTLNQLSIVSGGRGYVRVVEPTCGKSSCEQGYEIAYISYELSDGSYALMTQTTYDDGRSETIWTSNGERIDAPLPRS